LTEIFFEEHGLARDALGVPVGFFAFHTNSVPVAGLRRLKTRYAGQNTRD
jgi:hypothetical protein